MHGNIQVETENVKNNDDTYAMVHKVPINDPSPIDTGKTNVGPMEICGLMDNLVRSDCFGPFPNNLGSNDLQLDGSEVNVDSAQDK